MAFPGEQEFLVDLNGKAAIDTPLDQIQGAVAETIGQEVALGVQRGGDT